MLPAWASPRASQRRRPKACRDTVPRARQCGSAALCEDSYKGLSVQHRTRLDGPEADDSWPRFTGYKMELLGPRTQMRRQIRCEPMALALWVPLSVGVRPKLSLFLFYLVRNSKQTPSAYTCRCAHLSPNSQLQFGQQAAAAAASILYSCGRE